MNPATAPTSPSVLTIILTISLSGALGANVRYFLNQGIHRWLGNDFPWGVMLINISGSLLMGFLAVWITQNALNHQIRLACLVGFLGSYTTFSAYSMDALILIEKSQYAKAVCYLAGSVILGLAACFGGASLARLCCGPNSE